MPSQLHEALLALFRNRPALAAELLREVLGVEVPSAAARIESAELTELQPAEYRADLVVVLGDAEPEFAVVVEVQLSPDPDKQFVWPAYVANLRRRLRRPVCLLVVAVNEKTRLSASTPIDLGGGSVFRPLVLGQADVPVVIDAAVARADPELAVLSAMAHGRDADIATASRIASVAVEASIVLDSERSKLYFDLVIASLSEAARKELRAMDPAKYEYQSEWVREWLAKGKAEGKAEGQLEGRLNLLIRQLTLRFGPLGAAVQVRIRSRSIEELDAIGERLLTASSLEEALGER